MFAIVSYKTEKVQREIVKEWEEGVGLAFVQSGRDHTRRLSPYRKKFQGPDDDDDDEDC